MLPARRTYTGALGSRGTAHDSSYWGYRRRYRDWRAAGVFGHRDGGHKGRIRGITAADQGAGRKAAGKRGVIALGKVSPDINAFFNQRVTIHTGDSVWVGIAANFHTVDLPRKGEDDLPLIVPTGTLATGVNDAAGKPVLVQRPGPKRRASTRSCSGQRRQDLQRDQARIDSGLPFRTPQAVQRQVHQARRLQVLLRRPSRHGRLRGRRPKGKPIPTAAQDAAALKKHLTKDIFGAAKLAQG